MRKADLQQQEAQEELRQIIKPGDTVYTVLRHVSRSGMTRGIDLYTIKDNRPRWLTGLAGKAMGTPQSRADWDRERGLRVSGCGMDMGFHLVYNLAYYLFGDGYALKHEWL